MGAASGAGPPLDWLLQHVHGSPAATILTLIRALLDPTSRFPALRSPKMEKLDTTPSSPTVTATYKKEAELEIWKMKSNGEYALLKTYPMCRWSGQLGP